MNEGVEGRISLRLADRVELGDHVRLTPAGRHFCTEVAVELV